MYRVLLDSLFELLLSGKMVAITTKRDTVSSYNDEDDDAAFIVSLPVDKGQFCQRAGV